MNHSNSYKSEIIAFTIQLEGNDKLSTDRMDSGNWTGGKVGRGELKGTKFGISAASYPHEDIARLTRDRAIEIYERDFYDRLGIQTINPGVAMMLFDIAVNSGVSRAVKYAGATSDLRSLKRIYALNEMRLSFWHQLKGWVFYGRGWKNREVALLKKALELWGRG